MNVAELPISIQKYIENKPYMFDEIGESDSSVFIFEDMVLKIEKTGNNSNREYDALTWLKDKLPVPEILAFEQKNGFNCLLMTRIKEKTICDNIAERSPENTIEALADGINKLWSVDISDCPLNSQLSVRLVEVKHRIDNDFVDINDFEENTLGDDGFKNVDDLYHFLLNNQPEEDLVFTHGDYCLPNSFIKENKTVGFIDLGKAGIADRWQDLALCIRSMEYNFCKINGMLPDEFKKLKDYFLNLLNIEMDNKKLRYYILLDELF